MSLEREKDNVHYELERMQRELGEAYRTKAELELKKEESHTLKIQLDDEEQNRYKGPVGSLFLFMHVNSLVQGLLVLYSCSCMLTALFRAC